MNEHDNPKPLTAQVMHPIFPGSVRVTLVESVKQPGMLAVAVRGGRFACPLPYGYDGLTQVHIMSNGQVIAWHPTRETLVCDPSRGTTSKADIPAEFYFKDRRR